MRLEQRPPPSRPPGASPGEAAVPGSHPDLTGILLVLLGAVLLALAAQSALAGTVSGGDGGDVLLGSAQDETIAGRGDEDGLYGLAGSDALVGGGGDDELYGGPGRDLLLGGEGDDFVEAKDGEADYVDCGPGADVAGVDFEDRASPDCEAVYPS
ncbi:MAG: hypothetical protein AB1425_13080 [Actinomycetota bacterium]